MKRNALIAAFVAVIIIVLIILGFKSCNPRTKIVTSDAEIYSAFINANIEFTCMVMKDTKLAENTPENHKKLDEVYAKHKLPVDNNYQMLGILQKYSNDEGVTAIIQQNSENCLTGDSPIFYQAAAN